MAKVTEQVTAQLKKPRQAGKSGGNRVAKRKARRWPGLARGASLHLEMTPESVCVVSF
jgi:hypothetical protein